MPDLVGVHVNFIRAATVRERLGRLLTRGSDLINSLLHDGDLPVPEERFDTLVAVSCEGLAEDFQKNV